MSGYFDAMDYVIDLANIIGSYQAMNEEEGKPKAGGDKKEISRSSKLGKKDTRTLTKQQLAFDRLEAHLKKNFGAHMLERFSNYIQNGFFFLKTMNSFPDFTKSGEEVVRLETVEDAVWNTLLAPQIALLLAECAKVSEILRIKQKVPTSTFDVLVQLIANWQPGMYRDGKHGKNIIKTYLNQAGKVRAPEFIAAINKRGVKGAGYRTIKEHLEILQAELLLHDSNNIEETLTRVASCYHASVIMYRLETMTNGEKRLDAIKYFLDDSMVLQEKGFAGIDALADIPKGIREKPYLIRNFDLFRELAYRTPDQTAMDIIATKFGPDSLGTPMQQLAQDRLIEFYSDIGIDIREWMSTIWPRKGSVFWPEEENAPLPGNKNMKELSEYWSLYYRMYGNADIGNYHDAYKYCEQALKFGKKFHVGEYHAAALIHMVVISTKLEELNAPEIDVRLNKNKVDGLLAELAYLLPDGGEINIVLNEKIADAIHGSAEELLYSLAFRKYNQAHKEKVSPFRRLERLCQAALDIVRNHSEANLNQRVKLYRKALREGEPRITASTLLLNYSARLDPSVFIDGILDLPGFYGVTPEVFFLFNNNDEAKELFHAFYGVA